jgi:hypothetical protein
VKTEPTAPLKDFLILQLEVLYVRSLGFYSGDEVCTQDSWCALRRGTSDLSSAILTPSQHCTVVLQCFPAAVEQIKDLSISAVSITLQ